MRPTLGNVQKLRDRAVNMALKCIIKRAQSVLRRYPHLEDFSMAMGTAFFTYKVGTRVNGIILKKTTDRIIHDPPKYLRPFDDYLNELDSLIGPLTGIPLRVTIRRVVREGW